MSVVLRHGFVLASVPAGFVLAQMLVYYLPAAEHASRAGLGVEGRARWRMLGGRSTSWARPLGSCWCSRDPPFRFTRPSGSSDA